MLKKIINTTKTVLAFALVLVLIECVLIYALRASEYEDCMQWDAHAEQGFPIVVPDYCVEYIAQGHP